MTGTTAETAELLLHQAAAAGNGGDLAQAERLCRTVLGAQPNNAAALHLLATIIYRAGDLGAALAAINRVAALQPKSAEAVFSRGPLAGLKSALPRSRWQPESPPVAFGEERCRDINLEMLFTPPDILSVIGSPRHQRRARLGSKF